MKRRGFLAGMKVDDWKRGIALVILWTYAYQLVAWVPITWACDLASTWLGVKVPGPPIVPWEALISGTGTLATVGSIQTWRDRTQADIERQARAPEASS